MNQRKVALGNIFVGLAVNDKFDNTNLFIGFSNKIK